MIILLLGLAILTVAVFMLYRLLRQENIALNIAIEHTILSNGVIEVELQDLSTLWMDEVIPNPTIERAPVPVKQEESTEWYETDDFIQFLINCISERLNQCSGNNFAAFSFNGVVYLTPSALWSYITTYTKAKNITGIEQKQATMLSVVQSLIKRGLIRLSDIKEGQYTAVYRIITSIKDSKLKPKGVYIPLIAKYFNTDNKREGILTFITNVEPYKEASNAE